MAKQEYGPGSFSDTVTKRTYHPWTSSYFPKVEKLIAAFTAVGISLITISIAEK